MAADRRKAAKAEKGEYGAKANRGHSAPRPSLMDFLRHSPLAEAMAEDELDFECERAPVRAVKKDRAGG